MALTDSFLATCRAAIALLPELATFRTAKTLAETGTRAQRTAAWNAAYSDAQAGLSPAYRLRKAVRDTVNAQADTAGTLGLLDRESAYQTLVAEVVTTVPPPSSAAAEYAAFQRLVTEDQLS